MTHVCSGCEGPLKKGEEVVQMLHGIWQGKITPKFDQPIAEWHASCFKDFPLLPQSRPYKCDECGGDILYDQRVSFLVKGKATDEDSVTAEERGYLIFTVKHYPGCDQRSRSRVDIGHG